MLRKTLVLMMDWPRKRLLRETLNRFNRYDRYFHIVCRRCQVESKKIGMFFGQAPITPPDSGFSPGDKAMQIHRIDIPASGDTSRPAMVSGANSKRELAGASSRENEAEGAVGGNELDQLSRLLGGISDVRPDVVAAARVRVQRGDYLTRTAAEETAAVILNKDV